MHILLTRPLKDSRELILKFQKLGHNVSHLPLISIERKNHEKINFSEFKSIIFTSSNSVNFLDTAEIDKKIICFCVGSATEQAVRKKGFQNVISADGNVRNLKELILQYVGEKHNPEDGLVTVEMIVDVMAAGRSAAIFIRIVRSLHFLSFFGLTGAATHRQPSEKQSTYRLL